MQNAIQNSEVVTGTEVDDTIEVASHMEAHVPIQGPSFQTAFCNVGYRHDNGPAWNSRTDYAAFETPFGKVRVGSYHVNMYGYPFSIGDRIHAQPNDIILQHGVQKGPKIIHTGLEALKKVMRCRDPLFPPELESERLWMEQLGNYEANDLYDYVRDAASLAYRYLREKRNGR